MEGFHSPPFFLHVNLVLIVLYGSNNMVQLVDQEKMNSTYLNNWLFGSCVYHYTSCSAYLWWHFSWFCSILLIKSSVDLFRK